MAKKDYLGLGRLVSIILAIIPITSWILGFVTRFQEGKIVAGIIRLLFGWNIIWFLDLIFMLVKGSIFRLLNCQFPKTDYNKKAAWYEMLHYQTAFFVLTACY